MSSFDGRSNSSAPPTWSPRSSRSHLYHLLTGKLPFHADGLADIEERQPIVPPKARRPELPRALDAITRKLLEYDRDRRPGSAAVVLAELPEAAAGELDLAEYMRRLAEEQGRRSTRRRTRLVRLASLALAAIVGAGVLYTAQHATASDQPADATPTAATEPTPHEASPGPEALDNETELDSEHSVTGPHQVITTSHEPRREQHAPTRTLTAENTARRHSTARANPSPAVATPPASRATAISAPADSSLDNAKLYGPDGSGVYYPGGRKDAE